MKLKVQLESQKRDLDLRGEELMKREKHNEIERKKLAEDLEQVPHVFFSYWEFVVFVYSQFLWLKLICKIEASISRLSCKPSPMHIAMA